MKKIVILIVLILILGFGFFCFTTDVFKPLESLNELEISKLSNESYLDILVNIESYNSESVENYKLLEAAMRIARELNLVQSVTDPVYLEYVSRDTVHLIIEELTGKKLSDPIVEEDFYYLYDSENDYYYIVPVGTDWIHIGKIKAVNKKGNNYTIYCSAVESDYNGGSTVVYEDMKIELQRVNNKHIKYLLKSIERSKKLDENEKHFIVTEYGKSNDGEELLYYSFIPQEIEKIILINFSNNFDLADELLNYYKNNLEAYRNTEIVITCNPERETEALQDLYRMINPDILLDIHTSEEGTIGDGSLAEIFEEELNLKHISEFKDDYSDYFTYWAHENGSEALFVGAAENSISTENLINALDKII